MKALLLFCLVAFLNACVAVDLQSSGARVPVQYATLKVIEDSDTVSASDVLEHTQRIRAIATAETSLSLVSLLDDTVELIDLNSFEPSDRLLLLILFNNIEQAIADVRPDMPLQEQRVRLITLLNWIDQAARLAQ